MTSCSPIFAPVRFVLRNRSWGHDIMRPSPVAGHKFELRCSECLRRWPVAQDFSPTFVSVKHGIARVLRWKDKVA